MAIQSVFTKKALAVKFGELATHGAVFKTASGATPGTEPVGGATPYARKPLTWSAPDANNIVTASAVVDVPAGTTVVATGLHNALTGGQFVAGKSNAPVTFPNADTVTVNFSYKQS